MTLIMKKNQFQKKNHMAQISKLYISLDITMMMLLDHYVCFDSNKTMSFKAIDNRLLRKYTKIWKKKVINLIVKI